MSDMCQRIAGHSSVSKRLLKFSYDVICEPWACAVPLCHII